MIRFIDVRVLKKCGILTHLSGNMTLRFSSSSEAKASELLENNEGTFFPYLVIVMCSLGPNLNVCSLFKCFTCVDNYKT